MSKRMKKTGTLPESVSTKSDSLFGASTRLDPTLASLFSANTTTSHAKRGTAKLSNGSKASKQVALKESPSDTSESNADSATSIGSDDDEDNDAGDASSESEFSAEDIQDDDITAGIEKEAKAIGQADSASDNAEDEVKDAKHGRRKRKRQEDDIEGRYLQRLAEEEQREDEERQSKRQKETVSAETQPALVKGLSADEEVEALGDEEDKNVEVDEEDEESDFEIPKHETQLAPGETPEFEKANRTVFLGNVASSSITSKVAKKALIRHMSSFLEALPQEKDQKIPHKLESIRFRSTAYTNLLPKKAAFAQQDLMDATSHSTNAYVVYTTKIAARAALKLNGTTVLDRHLRVDSVAHPAKSDSKRCVFIGNLGFVDDESGQHNEDEKKKDKKQKEPGDTEEGLWRQFSKCGVVENVRVVRDAKTRVGKGIAYVQFTDENAVEAALLYDGQKFPPLLPRKLRVTRAKTLKRNAVAKRELQHGRKTGNGIYNPKISAAQKSAQGRAGKLFGRAGAAMMNRPVRSQQQQSRGPRTTGANNEAMGAAHTKAVVGEIKGPESFVFEGNRAKRDTIQAGGKKVKKSKKKIGKPANRSTKRAAAWRKSGSGA